MTTREAWRVVSSELLNCGQPFTALGFLPGRPGQMLDDNADATDVPPTGGIRLFVSGGTELPHSSPGGVIEPLVFAVELNHPFGSGNGLVQDYAEQVKALFRGRTLIADGGSGAIYCKRIAVDYLGRAHDGRGLYRTIVNVVFDDYSYH